MLRQSGYNDEDWEIQYFPNEKAYVLKFDGDTIFMRKIIPMSKFAEDAHERTDI